MISEREYYAQFTEEEIESPDFESYRDFLEGYGDWLYEIEKDKRFNL
jgi:hypothetical protein